MKKRSPRRGFTLVEMMVVVAIVAVLTTLATATLRSNERPADVATKIGNLVQSGSRTAVRHGVVRADVVVSEGNKRRARLVATATPRLTFFVQVLAEDPAPTWHTLATYSVPKGITIEGYAPAVGDYTTLAGTLSSDWSAFAVNFDPSGSSNSVTLFLSAEQGLEKDRRARLSVLPLGTATFVRTGWE
ncbi:MAG: prepilin-type N-terminal cleavage/methylation domain-containing protein [Kofleriaceae bacterium]